jgi:hypothetical protein
MEVSGHLQTQQLYARGKGVWHPLDMRLDVPQSRPDRFGENISFPCQKSNLSRPAIPTEPSLPIPNFQSKQAAYRTVLPGTVRAMLGRLSVKRGYGDHDVS